MNSMTGFGKSELTTKLGKIIVEISTVNNRYLEISPRTPRSFLGLEPKIREVVSKLIGRGKVNLFINFEEKIDENVRSLIHRDIAKVFYNQLSKLKKDLKISGEITVHDLLLNPEITKPETVSLDDKQIWAALEKVLTKAIAALVTMRKKEGEAIKKDMKGRLKILGDTIKNIEAISADCVDKYREKLQAKISEMLEANESSATRFEEEIAYLAERTDIAEECTRFYSHLKQYSATINEKGPVGKKLNFILQELNREANTVASKCNDIAIAGKVIVIKEEIEKLREQVQNIE